MITLLQYHNTTNLFFYSQFPDQEPQVEVSPSMFRNTNRFLVEVWGGGGGGGVQEYNSPMHIFSIHYMYNTVYILPGITTIILIIILLAQCYTSNVLFTN